MQGKYLELCREIDAILKSKKKMGDKIDKIITTLQGINETDFKTPNKTPSIAHALSRARGLEGTGVGKKVVSQLLEGAKTLLIFEDLKLKIKESKKPDITNEDIKRIQDTSWLPKCRPMVGLIDALERIERKDFSKYKKTEKTFDYEGAKRGLLKFLSNVFKVTPVKEARNCINKIRSESKLIMTVQFLRIISADYLENAGVEFPKNGDGLFKENVISNDDYNVRVHQVFYNLSFKFESLVDDVIVQEEYKKMWDQRDELKQELFKLTNMLDEKSRVPTKITEETYHAAATYLHVLMLLKRLVEDYKYVQGLLVVVWGDYYKMSFATSKHFNEKDLSKNSMFENLRYILSQYEGPLNGNAKPKSTHHEIVAEDDFDSELSSEEAVEEDGEKLEKVVETNDLDEEEESSSGSFHSFN